MIHQYVGYDVALIPEWQSELLCCLKRLKKKKKKKNTVVSSFDTNISYTVELLLSLLYLFFFTDFYRWIYDLFHILG